MDKEEIKNVNINLILKQKENIEIIRKTLDYIENTFAYFQGYFSRVPNTQVETLEKDSKEIEYEERSI